MIISKIIIKKTFSLINKKLLSTSNKTKFTRLSGKHLFLTYTNCLLKPIELFEHLQNKFINYHIDLILVKKNKELKIAEVFLKILKNFDIKSENFLKIDDNSLYTTKTFENNNTFQQIDLFLLKILEDNMGSFSQFESQKFIYDQEIFYISSTLYPKINFLLSSFDIFKTEKVKELNNSDQYSEIDSNVIAISEENKYVDHLLKNSQITTNSFNYESHTPQDFSFFTLNNFENLKKKNLNLDFLETGLKSKKKESSENVKFEPESQEKKYQDEKNVIYAGLFQMNKTINEIQKILNSDNLLLEEKQRMLEKV